MADKIEIIFYDRVGNFKRGQVAEIEDGVFLRAVLKNGMADVVNPPDWSPEKADEEAKEVFKIEDIVKPKRSSKTVSAETN